MLKNRRSGLVAGVMLFLLATAGPASGQAWTPATGSGSVSVSFQHVEVGDHLFSVDITGEDFGNGYVGRGRRAFLGDIEANSLTLRVDYGFNDRLALSAALPFVAAKYSGRDPESNTVIDDGSFHSGFQDSSVELRYKAFDGAVVVTPFVAYTTPAGDYEPLGHAAIGRHLSETRIGSYVGVAFYPLLTYVHASYSYAFVERVLGVSTDRSDIALAVGYQASPSFGVRLFGTHLDTRGGLDWWTDFDPELEHDHGLDQDQVFHFHDQLSRSEATRVGLGLIYSLSQRFDLDFAFSKTVGGKNTHEATSSTFSVIWNF